MRCHFIDYPLKYFFYHKNKPSFYISVKYEDFCVQTFVYTKILETMS